MNKQLLSAARKKDEQSSTLLTELTAVCFELQLSYSLRGLTDMCVYFGGGCCRLGSLQTWHV